TRATTTEPTSRRTGRRWPVKRARTIERDVSQAAPAHATMLSSSALSRLHRLARRLLLAVALHVVHEPVTQLERLIPTMHFAAARVLPTELDDHTLLIGADDAGFRVCDLESRLRQRASCSSTNAAGVPPPTGASRRRRAR